MTVPHQLIAMYLKQNESVQSLPSAEEERKVFVPCAVTELPTVCQEHVQTVAELRPKQVAFVCQVMASCAYANMDLVDP